MQTSQQLERSREGVRFDSKVQEGNDRSESDSSEGDVILGIISVGAHDTIGSNGRRCGYVMGLVDLTGKKYYVDIPETVYQSVVDVYSIAVQGYETPDQHVPVPVGEDPTGSIEEIERMRSMLEQTTVSTDVMRKLGFVSDDDMIQSVTVDPVEDILAIASDEEEYEDPDEEDFDEEDVGSL